MSSDKEKSVMAIYDQTLPTEFVGVRSTVNHLPWSLLVIALGLIFWLTIALIHAENQRYALASGICQDRIFPAEVDTQCLAGVRSRQYWWQHVLYAMGHVGS
jgi:hypothetical protein